MEFEHEGIKTIPCRMMSARATSTSMRAITIIFAPGGTVDDQEERISSRVRPRALASLLRTSGVPARLPVSIWDR